jgi:hypothetical protein
MRTLGSARQIHADRGAELAKKSGLRRLDGATVELDHGRALRARP